MKKLIIGASAAALILAAAVPAFAANVLVCPVNGSTNTIFTPAGGIVLSLPDRVLDTPAVSPVPPPPSVAPGDGPLWGPLP